MEDVPLNVAISNLATQAQLNVILDPELADPSVGGLDKVRAQPTVSIRWEKVSARQALAALLDNYDLVMVRDPAESINRIKIKAGR